ncbi:MAG: hypothetical protein IKR59_05670, partial [Lachnospiraceae bacterium]|nr:hypothetical protein [Lachnospiraceae bacterium]
ARDQGNPIQEGGSESALRGKNTRGDRKPRGGRKALLQPVLYIFVEAVMLVLIKVFEVCGIYPRAVTFLMYGAIVLNTLYTGFLFVRYLIRRKKTAAQEGYGAGGDSEDSGEDDTSEACGKNDDFLRVLFIALALLFTLAADTFLVLLDDYYLAGVLLFCVVQTLYGIALKPRPVSGAVRITAFLLVWLVLALLHMAEPLNVASAYSITQLTINAVLALKKAREEKKAGAHTRPGAVLFALGLVLFWCCDVSVGIFNLSFGMEKLYLLNRITWFLMWVFYLPSQVLLVFAERQFLVARNEETGVRKAPESSIASNDKEKPERSGV